MHANRYAWGLILPSLALALFIISYPFFTIVWQSLHEVSRYGQVRDFTGWANFAAVLADPVFLASCWRTLWWTLAVVLGTLTCSLPLALVLQQEFYGRGLARAIIMLPWAISLAMSAIIWRWAFNDEFGLINLGLQQLGLLSQAKSWLAQPESAFLIEIAIGIWVSIPFTVSLLMGGLATLPAEIYEAARLEGASYLLCLRRLTLPLIKPFISMAVVLNLIYVFNSFPIIWVMTQGGPDNQTHILVTYLYELAFRLGRPGQAAAVSLMMLLILVVITAFYLRLQKREAAHA